MVAPPPAFQPGVAVAPPAFPPAAGGGGNPYAVPPTHQQVLPYLSCNFPSTIALNRPHCR
jgi:hypothetical protein